MVLKTIAVTAIFVSAGCATPFALAQRILTAKMVSGAASSDICIGGQVWLRLRGSSRPAEAQAIVGRVERALLSGVRGSDVAVQKVGEQALVLARGKLLVAVGRQEAAAQRSSVLGLANKWAGALRALVAEPYVAVGSAGGMDIPVGEMRTLAVGGTAKGMARTASLTPTVVSVEAMGAEGVSLRGVAFGDGLVEVSTAAEKVRIPIRVRHWAVVAPSTVSAFVAAPVNASEWQRFSQYALMCSLFAQPGAKVCLNHCIPSWPRFLTQMSAVGPELLSVSRQIEIIGQVKPTKLSMPTHVLVSNYPERVTFSNVLMRDVVQKSESVRILWHHVNDSPQSLWFGIRIHNISEAPVSFSWADVVAGPNRDEVYVGHLACRGHLDQLRRGIGLLLSLEPHRSVEFSTVLTRRGEIVSGLAWLSVLGGGPIVAEVVAHSDKPLLACHKTPDKMREDPKLRPFRFEGSNRRFAAYRVGGPWTFVSMGRQPKFNDRGIVLHGNYGVLYQFDLVLANPTSEEAEVELAVRSGGGPARGSFIISDETVETPLLRAGNEHVLARWTLAPAAERQVQVLSMPQSGSNYPVTLIMRPPIKRR